MISMIEMINRICEDDKSLCEAVLDLYRHVETESPISAISTRLWQRIEQMYQTQKLGDVLGLRNSMRPAGVPMSVGGAMVIMLAGKCDDPNIVSYNPNIGRNVPERIVINIGPYISKYYAEHKVDFTHSYNDIVYAILKENWADITRRIDERLSVRAKESNLVDASIDQRKRMYATDPEV